MDTPGKCPFHHGQAAVADEPARIRKLPMLRGFRVPWFVMKINGEFDFRIMDTRKLVHAIKRDLCWVCGEKLGKFKSFVIGPMCGINRTSAEPPSHRDCAIYSATHCPFLSRPHMKRREDEVSESMKSNVAGIGLERNPGACAVWTTKGYVVFPDPDGRPLIEVGEPEEVLWFAEGRAATRAEVKRSIDTGIHHLRALCDMEASHEIAEAHAELDSRIAVLEQLLPTE